MRLACYFLVGILFLFFSFSTSTLSAISLGIDELEKSGFKGLVGKRVGLVTNPSGVNSEGRSTIDVLRKAPGVKLVALFGPEHGVYGTVKAGDYVASQIDKRTGLKVHSLYNSTRKPTPDMLQGLDCIVYDLQDIGCRSYTFISTLGLVMEAASEQGVEVMVLDRPNPLGGMRVEGPRLEKRFKSFVGMYDIPYVYGMTVGELARWVNREYLSKPCNLVVVPMKDWKRSMVWEDTKLSWVPTSPNIPKAVATRGYVATGLVGEAGIANGANDRYPFEVIATDKLNAEAFTNQMNSMGWKGVRFEPYIAPHPKNPKRILSGARLRIDPKAPANLTSISIYAMQLIRRMMPHKNYFEISRNGQISLFDKINGTDDVRLALIGGKKIGPLVNSWNSGVESWLKQRESYLIYTE